MLVDSHCHLNFPDFLDHEGVGQIVANANEAGVKHMVSICTKMSEFDQIFDLTMAHDALDCSVGIHPHEADEEGERDYPLEQLIAKAKHPRVIAIGETGLDYFYETAPKQQQRDSFIKHIHACLELDMPIIIHSRDADEEMAEILKSEGQGKLRGVMHCFSSGPGLAKAALDLGFYISMSGIVTFKKADELRDIVQNIVPVDKLLVETDAPYLAPVPFRGKRNEPAFVTHTAAKVAEIKGMSAEEIAKITTDNFYRLFDKAERRL